MNYYKKNYPFLFSSHLSIYERIFVNNSMNSWIYDKIPENDKIRPLLRLL